MSPENEHGKKQRTSENENCVNRKRYQPILNSHVTIFAHSLTAFAYWPIIWKPLWKDIVQIYWY